MGTGEENDAGAARGIWGRVESQRMIRWGCIADMARLSCRGRDDPAVEQFRLHDDSWTLRTWQFQQRQLRLHPTKALALDRSY